MRRGFKRTSSGSRGTRRQRQSTSCNSTVSWASSSNGHIIDDEPSTDGAGTRPQERLEDAKKYFADYLAEQRAERGDEFPDWLTNLESKITNQLKTTLFPVEQESDVGVIFEVMNNRGKPLSELEKVKNYLLYVASKIDDSNQLGRDINGTWGRVLECLMAGGLGPIRRRGPAPEDPLADGLRSQRAEVGCKRLDQEQVRSARKPRRRRPARAVSANQRVPEISRRGCHGVSRRRTSRTNRCVQGTVRRPGAPTRDSALERAPAPNRRRSAVPSVARGDTHQRRPTATSKS